MSGPFKAERAIVAIEAPSTASEAVDENPDPFEHI